MRDVIRQKLTDLEPRWATIVAARSYLRARKIVSDVDLVSSDEILYGSLLHRVDPLVGEIVRGDSSSYEHALEWDELRAFVRDRRYDDGAPGRAAWLEDQVGLAWYILAAWSGSGNVTRNCFDCLSAAWSNMDLLCNESKMAGWVGPELGELELASQLDDLDSTLARGGDWPQFDDQWSWLSEATVAFRVIWGRQ